MKWISVKKKLPETYADVLVTDGDRCFIGELISGNGDKMFRYYVPLVGIYDDYFWEISHWMELPKVPDRYR